MAKGTFALVRAGPEDMRFGLSIEIDLEHIPGASTAGVIRPGYALAGLYIRPEGPSDYCTQNQVAGCMLALLLLLLLRVCQPHHLSLSRGLWKRVL